MRSLSAMFALLSSQASDQRSRKGRPLANSNWRHGNTVAGDRLFSLVSQTTARGHTAEDNVRWLAGELRQVERAADRSKVEDSWSARDQDDVGRARSSQRSGFSVWRRIDDGKARTALLGSLQHGSEARGLAGHDSRRIGMARVSPGRSGRLWIEVDHHRRDPGPFGSDSNVQRKRGLAGTALLTQESKCLHADMNSI